MDTFSILNYQGSKKNLIQFIHDSLKPYIREDDIIFDIFCGTCSVGYSYKSSNTVYANDCEKYASIIAKALLGKKIQRKDILNKPILNSILEKNIQPYKDQCFLESKYISSENTEKLIDLYNDFSTVWNGGIFKQDDQKYNLFISLYSTSYFGILQAIEIDSIREYIEKCNSEYEKNILFSSLFYSMKECVFSKDGHMAQPLGMEKNKKTLLKKRKKSVIALFEQKINDFLSSNFVDSKKENLVFNSDLNDLLMNDEVLRKADVVYADPPYTDMQYSRYYHLLNTVITYKYSQPSESNKGFTKGLYLNNRFQSSLSKRSTFIETFGTLIEYCGKNNKTLAISFAYPENPSLQKTDRYLASISELQELCKKFYSESEIHLKSINYKHSNNRNSSSKKVYEYLIICTKREKR